MSSQRTEVESHQRRSFNPQRSVRVAVALASLLAGGCAHSSQLVAVDPLPGSLTLNDSLIKGSGNGGYDVESYYVGIRFESAEQPIDANARIRATATQDLSSFSLDLHGLEVSSIDVEGMPATFERADNELIITPFAPIPAGLEFEVLVKYGGMPEGVRDETTPMGLTLGWNTNEHGEVYVVSEPNGAMSFMPCNDHPLDKARFTFRITVPKPLTAVANGTLTEQLDAGSRTTFVWSARDPIATYLVTIGIAEFEAQELTGPNGLEIVNYFAPRTTEKQRRNFDKTGAVVESLAKYFGPYPFEICGGILADWNLPGALETQTIPVYGRSAGSETTIAHEIAHQWFGNSVTLEDWSEIWLNEGFAAFGTWLYVEDSQGPENYEKMAYGSYKGMRNFTQPTAPGRVGAREMFGAAVYVRGPLVLHALRLEVGDDVFFEIMRAWAARHRNGNVTIEDFKDLSSELAGRDVSALLDEWIYAEEMPHIAAWDERIEEEERDREERRAAREARKAERAAAKEADTAGE